MDAMRADYDTELLRVVRAWAREGRDRNRPEVGAGVGVVWQPGEAVDLVRWAPGSMDEYERGEGKEAEEQEERDALSGRDCFHPSWRAHQRLGAGFWNRLTLGMVSRALGQGAYTRLRAPPPADAQRDKARPIEWRDEVLVRCLEPGDLLPVGEVPDR
jgi:phospholipase B1